MVSSSQYCVHVACVSQAGARLCVRACASTCSQQTPSFPSHVSPLKGKIRNAVWHSWILTAVLVSPSCLLTTALFISPPVWLLWRHNGIPQWMQRSSNSYMYGGYSPKYGRLSGHLFSFAHIFPSCFSSDMFNQRGRPSLPVFISDTHEPCSIIHVLCYNLLIFYEPVSGNHSHQLNQDL